MRNVDGAEPLRVRIALGQQAVFPDERRHARKVVGIGLEVLANAHD